MNGYEGSTIRPFIEPLTRREKEILALLGEGLTCQEIAVRLTLAVSSVRWYIQQVYGKLGVNSKRQALARSRALGLLKPALPLPGPLAFQEPKHNLPRQLTSFISRKKEINQVKNLLREYLLVTLTGSGGVGKTRLSLKVAEEVLADYPEGVWYIELAPLADPTLVPQQVAFALGLREEPNRPILDSLASYLHSRQALLILDNCEHLLDACVRLSDRLLHGCPRLKILATSREPLGVAGEAIYRVPSLAFPDPVKAFDVENLEEYSAIHLFVDRARLVLPEFQLTIQNAPSLAAICQRLDGIPLAIELAAGRVGILTAEQLAKRLNDAFRLLTGGSRTVLPRHQTLRSLIDWSYNLLSEEDRILLRRLSVFAGSWTLEAAEQVCCDEGEAPIAILPADVLDRLGELVNKSLVLPARQGDREVRFAMLETIRQYAHEKLVDEKEAEAVCTRHMHYYRQMAEKLAPKIRSREQIKILDQLEQELGNLRLALEWALQTDIETELKMAAVLRWLWHIRTHWSEGIEWLERGLDPEKAAHDGRLLVPLGASIRAETLMVLGFLLAMRGSYILEVERVKACLEESITLYKANGLEYSSGCGWAIVLLGCCWSNINLDQAQTQAKAQTLAREALVIFRQIGDPHGMAESLQLLGGCEFDPALRRKLLQEGLAIDQANGDIEGTAAALMNISQAYCQEAEWEQAVQAMEGSLDNFRQVHNPHYIGNGLAWLGLFSILNGDLISASQHVNDALAFFVDLGDISVLTLCWCIKSQLNICEGDYSQAAKALDLASHFAKETGNRLDAVRLLVHLARLARLQGDADQAQQLIHEAMKICNKQHLYESVLPEMAYQALESDHLNEAVIHLQEGIQYLIQIRYASRWDDYIDGLTLLAARQSKLELAALLSATRWFRGHLHILSPSERAFRTGFLEEIGDRLGEEKFTKLSQAGQAMNFMQMLETLQEYLELPKV